MPHTCLTWALAFGFNRLFMKNIARFLLLSFLVYFGGFLISWVDTNSHLLKKLDKTIEKSWDIDNISKQEIKSNAAESGEKDRKLFELWQQDSLIGYAVLNRSYGCRVGGCAVYSASSEKDGSYDPFYYSILTDTHFAIKNVSILEYYSEYGYEITNKKWLAQFIGKSGKDLEYGNNIDAISGATISVKSLIENVDETLLELKKAVN